MTTRKRKSYPINHFDHDGSDSDSRRTRTVRVVKRYKELICSDCLPKQRAAEAKNKCIMFSIFGIVCLGSLIIAAIVIGVMFGMYNKGSN
jgi:hypothetical protein